MPLSSRLSCARMEPWKHSFMAKWLRNGMMKHRWWRCGVLGVKIRVGCLTNSLKLDKKCNRLTYDSCLWLWETENVYLLFKTNISFRFLDHPGGERYSFAVEIGLVIIFANCPVTWKSEFRKWLGALLISDNRLGYKARNYVMLAGSLWFEYWNKKKPKLEEKIYGSNKEHAWLTLQPHGGIWRLRLCSTFFSLSQKKSFWEKLEE